MAGSIKKIVQNSALIAAGLIFGNISSMLFRVIIARVYGPSSFGVFSIGFMLVSISTTLAVLGFPAGVTRFVSRYRSIDNEVQIPTVFAVSIAITLTLGTLLTVSLTLLGQPLVEQVLNSPDSADFIRWFAYQVPANAIILLTGAFVLGYERGGLQITIRKVTPEVLVLSFTLGIAFFDGTIIQVGVGYVVAKWIAAFIGLGISIWVLKRSEISTLSPTQPINEAQTLLKYSFPLLLTTFSGFFLNWIDTFFVAFYLDNAKLGVYQVAFLLGSSLSIFFTAIGRSLFPNFSALLAEGNIVKAAQRYINGTRWALIISLAPFFYLLIFAETSLEMLFGSEYSSASIALIIILFGQLVAIASGPGTEVIKSKGHNKYILVVYLIAVVLNMTANVVLIPIIGIKGAAIGTSLALSVQALLLFVRSKAILNMSIPRVELFKIVSGGGLTYMIFHYLSINVKSFLEFVISICVFLLVYIIMVVTTGGVTRKEVSQILNSIWRWCRTVLIA